MADRPVSVVPGIGYKTEQILSSQGVTTIGKLAACDSRLIQSVPKICTFIAAAKKFLQDESPQPKHDVQPLNVLTGKVTKDEPPTSDTTALLLQSHTWFGTRATIPHDEETRDLIIWELCVEPNNRVSMICAWLDDEELCKMTYTAQFLLHYNPELPTLEVLIKPETLNGLLQKEALNNTLMEVDVMKRFC